MAPTHALPQSRRVRDLLEFALPVLRAGDQRLLEHPRIREVFPEYLVLAHGVVRASVPLMETALAVARTRPDEVARLLAGYLEQHIPEEVGHDEWLLGDLEFLGVPRERVLSQVPSAAVAALVGSQYYWIHHVDPVGLLGYVALLEGYPPVHADVDRVRTATGFGEAAFRTLLLHAELDQGHRDELDELLDALPLTDAQRSLVGLSALTSVQLYGRAQDELLDRYGGG